jgi:hypothetical protein
VLDQIVQQGQAFGRHGDPRLLAGGLKAPEAAAIKVEAKEAEAHFN